MAPSILFTGLPWNHSRVLDAGAPSVEAVRLGLLKAEQDLISAGYDVTCSYHAQEDGLQPFIDVLRSKDWDGVIIGMGVRGSVVLNEWFEGLVNAVREFAPRAKLGFNTRPDTTVAAARRIAPIVEVPVSEMVAVAA